jgi:hypothetical protein
MPNPAKPSGPYSILKKEDGIWRHYKRKPTETLIKQRPFLGSWQFVAGVFTALGILTGLFLFSVWWLT